MMPYHVRHERSRQAFVCVRLIVALLILTGCSTLGPEAGEPGQPPVLPPATETDTPQPPTPVPEYTSKISDAAGARLDVSIAVTEEDTQGRILQVVVRNETEAETVLYWTDPGADKIQRAQVDNWGVQDLVSEGLEEPRGIALDTRRGKMLWTDAGLDHIQRADLDGTDVESLVADGLLAPFGIALGDQMEAIFWSDAEALTLTRASIDGTNPSPAVGEASPATYGTVADDVRRQLYWIEQGGIHRAELDGLNVQLVLPSDSPPHALALDAEAGKIYWTEAGRILRANLDGTGKELLVEDFSGPSYGIALDVSEGWMYWTEFDSGKIRRAALDGSQGEQVIQGLETPSGLALLKSGDAFVQLPCGLILEPEEGKGNLQRLMVIQEDGIVVPAGGSAELSPYVICVDAGHDIPEIQGEYNIGTIAEGSLLQLAECICERRLISEEEDALAYIGEQFGLQFAVWQVSGGLTPDELREQLELGGGAMDNFSEIAEMFDTIGAMLPDYVDWIETCGVEVAQ
jgi:hypothetical protein